MMCEPAREGRDLYLRRIAERFIHIAMRIFMKLEHVRLKVQNLVVTGEAELRPEGLSLYFHSTLIEEHSKAECKTSANLLGLLFANANFLERFLQHKNLPKLKLGAKLLVKVVSRGSHIVCAHLL